MDNKIKIILIVFLILAGFAYAIILGLQTTSQSEDYKKITNLMRDVNYCNEASDCITGQINCYFGCYSFFNKDTNLTNIIESAEIYKNKYGPCPVLAQCLAVPTSDEIDCVSNKCIDIRLKNK